MKTMLAIGMMVVALAADALMGCTQTVGGTGSGTQTGSSQAGRETNEGEETNTTAGNKARAGVPHCASGTYAADLHGEQALAKVTYEVLVERIAIAGEISSPSAYYTFKGDLYGDRGWVDVVTHGSNERFRAQIDVIPNGFVFTSNAYEGAGSTSYEFSCQ